MVWRERITGVVLVVFDRGQSGLGSKIGWTGLGWAWGLFLGGLSFGFGFILFWIRFWFI